MSIEVKELTHYYAQNTPFETKALDGINLSVNLGDFIGLVGQSGSGKSTLVRILSGLLKPTAGRVIYNGNEFSRKRNEFFSKGIIGLILQYPEHQLFEETVFADVSFGPKNMGLTGDAIKQRVDEALKLVGLSPDLYSERSPFELSGGEMRRVAIAGVLAMKPQILILDEPTAGLDPENRRALLKLLLSLNSAGTTVFMVSHSMEDIAHVAKRVVLLEKGRIKLNLPTRDIFRHYNKLVESGLDIPPYTRIMHMIRAKGYAVSTDVISAEEAADEVVKLFAGGTAS